MRARISRRSRYRLTVLEPVYHPIERHKTKTGIERYRERVRESERAILPVRARISRRCSYRLTVLEPVNHRLRLSGSLDKNAFKTA